MFYEPRYVMRRDEVSYFDILEAIHFDYKEYSWDWLTIDDFEYEFKMQCGAYSVYEVELIPRNGLEKFVVSTKKLLVAIETGDQ